MKIALVITLLLPMVCQAQVYKCTIDGRKVVTDKPCAGGVEVKIDVPKGSSDSGSGISKEKAAQINAAASRRIIGGDIDRKQAEINALRAQYDRIAADLKARMPSGNSDRAIATRNSLTSELTSIGQEYDRKMKDLESDLTRLKAQRDSIKDN